MKGVDNHMLENEYRSVSNRMGPAQDPSAVRKYDLKNDAVSVVHSGESDPMPNQEAQEAYQEADPHRAHEDREDMEANVREEAPLLDDAEILGDQEFFEDPEASDTREDENDFEAQQHLAEDADERDEIVDEGAEENAA